MPISFDPMSPETRTGAGVEFSRILRRWLLIFCQLEGVRPWRDACEPNFIVHRRTCIWVKPDGAPQFTGDRPGTGYECIEVMHALGASRWNGGGRRGVFTYNCNSQTRTAGDHETQKPIDLMVELVRLFTDPGDLILDPFAGSGTTGVAAIRLGRRFIGWERDPKYHAIAVKRLTAAREQLELCP
jgi:site-specific DNA-methyltransferase (adenine-specific)